MPDASRRFDENPTASNNVPEEGRSESPLRHHESLRACAAWSSRSAGRDRSISFPDIAATSVISTDERAPIPANPVARFPPLDRKSVV